MSSAAHPSLWRRIGNSWRTRGRRSGTIDLVADGFVFARGGRTADVRWGEVTRVDCGTRDTISIDLFFAVFHIQAGRSVTVDEYDDGFHPLENAVFAHWPEIRERWIALQCGPLHQPQFETVWCR